VGGRWCLYVIVHGCLCEYVCGGMVVVVYVRPGGGMVVVCMCVVCMW
jgi:hypothetical protein